MTADMERAAAALERIAVSLEALAPVRLIHRDVPASQAAAELGVHTRTVIRMIRTGRVCGKKMGRQWVVTGWTGRIQA